MKTPSLILVLVTLSLGAVALAESAGLAQQQVGVDPKDNLDAKIVAQVYNANAIEVQEGRLALTQSQSRAVKDLAAMLVLDHSQAVKEVEREAHRLGIDLAASPQDDKQVALAELDKLHGMKGADFDRAFINHEVDAHQQTIQVVRHAIDQVQDGRLKAMLEGMLLTLRNHLARAQELQSKLGNG